MTVAFLHRVQIFLLTYLLTYSCLFVHFVLDPQVEIVPHDHLPLFVQVGSRLHLTCKARDNPSELHWSRNRSSDHGCDEVEYIANESYGFHVDSGHGSSKSELMKNEIRWEDEALYFCRRTNGHNISGYSIYVAVVNSESCCFSFQ